MGKKKELCGFLLCISTQPTWVQIFRPVKISDYGSETDWGGGGELQYNCICTQPTMKQNHVFLKISIRKKNSLFRQRVMKKIYILNSYSAYLHN